jgi:hypothetical protein
LEREADMNGNEIDMRMFAQRIGASVTFSAGSIVFNKGDPGSCMYIVQSGLIEMVIGDKVIEICGPKRSDRIHVHGRRRAEKFDRARQRDLRTLSDRST